MSRSHSSPRVGGRAVMVWTKRFVQLLFAFPVAATLVDSVGGISTVHGASMQVSAFLFARNLVASVSSSSAHVQSSSSRKTRRRLAQQVVRVDGRTGTGRNRRLHVREIAPSRASSRQRHRRLFFTSDLRTILRC